jgi:ABC-type dipeptide/oligopeptide/nickel transport system permease component
MRGLDGVLRLVGAALLTIFVAVTINFVIFRAAPGDAVTNISAIPRASAQEKLALRHEFGLDKSLGEQYVLYLKQLGHGNLGQSFATRESVSHVLVRAIANTIPMVLLGTAIAIALGVALGVFAAYRHGGAGDHVGVGAALALYALPTQWVGLMLIVLFAGLLPTGGMQDEFLIDPGFWSHIQDVARHMLLPALTLGVGLLGQFALITRSSMLDVMGEDYVLTARAKGLGRRRVLTRHALRNATLPLVNLIALSLGTIVAGAVLVETVSSWPGIGRVVYTAVSTRDYPVLQGAFLVLTVSVVCCNLIADLVVLRLDPRVRA